MIVRLVRLKLKPEHVDQFLEFYSRSQPEIRAQPGCLSLALIRELGDPAAFATWSTWRSARDLQEYRRSAFFRGFWPVVKGLLREPADAASFEQVSGESLFADPPILQAHDAH